MSSERVQASVNLAAIERNCTTLRSHLGEGVSLCAVVKADGYGHGAVASARAALAGGARWLAVVSSAEVRELRDAGLREPPVLVMGALTAAELSEALAARADVVVWRERHVHEVAAAGGGRVHVKFDSGMGRLGTRDAEEAACTAELASRTAGVELVGVMTHFATADEADDGGFFEAQLDAFARWAHEIKERQPQLIAHAANSAAVMRDARSHFDLVRCGIAVYGLDPFGEDAAAQGLEPALELRSYVAEVKRVRAGESAGYGRRFVAHADAHLGVLPIGYGDGWRRGLSNNADVLIAGRRYPLVGTVSMDNVTVLLGAEQEAHSLRGEPAVLIGEQGSERISAEEVARRLDTINYEVTCALSARVPRAYHRDGAHLAGPSSGGADEPAAAAGAERG